LEYLEVQLLCFTRNWTSASAASPR